MPKEETLNYYEQKVRQVVHYIQNNLDKDLNVRTLAEKSNISFFHFHRIVGACLGVPVGTYINQLRLDTGAKLIKYTDEKISDIAFKIGYSDLPAFTKSFTREFGISPSEYRLNPESMINSSIDLQFSHNKIEKHTINSKIKIIPSHYVAFIRVKGKYGDQLCYDAWEKLFNYATENKLIGWNKEAFTVYLDDPDIVGIDNCTYDCCLTVKPGTHTTGEILTREIEGGKFLVFRYKGPYEKLWDVYELLYRECFIQGNQYQLRDSPVIEKYLKHSEKTKPENLITEIHLPIL